MDTCAERFDHFAMDFESDLLPTRKRTSDLLEDSLDKMWQTPITHLPRVTEDNSLEADYFDHYRLPGLLDDIFDTTEVMTAAQTANSTPVIECKFSDYQTEKCNQVSPKSSSNALEVSVEEKSDSENLFCEALRFSEQPRRKEDNRVVRKSRRI